ncbi:zf-HC2 domain-containing protein [Dactylosporangium sp. AC04546]|uniref:zf-HC2 domain-containing protein n=1 Tax=Dactylosporangium sp. AC04546 TaxID=2862460 RepID=UPI001EDEDD22|nr:zf-HC2 domain-containing protein [Dactylosporangium sp. AC04546]WVK78431.1 zf-HC2 domain-containing protein [Dactylosporangium sp. AC04546]
MIDRLAEYAAGTLDARAAGAVAAHLAGCPGCRAELAQWRELLPEPPDARTIVRQAMLRSLLDPPTPTYRPGWALVRAEARLLSPVVLVASAVVMALGALLAAVQGSAELLALVAPLVAAAGVSGVHGPRRDPAFEVIAATPTPLRRIVLLRVALILGYDVLLALAASAVLAAPVLAWLAPTALLSALCLPLLVRFGPDVAIGAALTAWALRMLDFGVVRAVWDATPAGWVATAVLAALGVILAGRGEPMGRFRATHLT